MGKRKSVYPGFGPRGDTRLGGKLFGGPQIQENKAHGTSWNQPLKPFLFFGWGGRGNILNQEFPLMDGRRLQGNLGEQCPEC